MGQPEQVEPPASGEAGGVPFEEGQASPRLTKGGEEGGDAIEYGSPQPRSNRVMMEEGWGGRQGRSMG